ncbi:kinesin-like protein KIF16B [Stylophora pistillata]|uniref:kinesin-like protein KIF16B n=1 Tax=Stylophora pistillata TaxID=50429 RepID=UPI000C046CEA|nr:kinesin-like protein KIF16B [Stylophora pistillata]
MASLKVAVRARPLNNRELELGSKCTIQMEGQKTTIFNTKLYGEVGLEGDKSRDIKKEFIFDYSYWSADSKDPHFVSQDQVFSDLGLGILESAFEGYNACLFAYGQTSAGKTYTMMGTNEEVGLIPRICKGLFEYIGQNTSLNSSFRTEVSYLEIYNEHVRDLLRPQKLKKLPQQNLKVREHPKEGPYVEGLTKQHVSDYDSIEVLMEQGNRLRATAATKMNNTSSRSHAIFTVKFTQARFMGDLPSETISKIHLVDLAGSERASSTGNAGERLKEGANINKSLVTLGIVISTLAENSINTSSSGTKRPSFRKKLFVPYRDSVLTFLLKDSLGGNAKTVMVAAISPAECNYGETLSTLRYAHRAKSIINMPTINEDPNVKLIRELRSEIERLKGLIRTGTGDERKSLDDPMKVTRKLQENQARVEQLTKDWTEKWKEAKSIMQESELQLRRHGSCVVLVDLELPHLVRLEEDPLRTEIMLYRVMHGKTHIGREDAPNPQDIVLEGEDINQEHCVLDFVKGRVTFEPISSLCWVNGVAVSQPTRLNQGDVIVLGKSDVFKFNFPTEAAKLREKRRSALYTAESTESLTNLHISPVRGSHGDLSMRSDSSSPMTLDSGVEVDLQGPDSLEEIKNQVTDLIARHKEAEVRRLEIEKTFQTEIDNKQKEIDSQKEHIQALRELHEGKSQEAREDLEQVRLNMDKKHEDSRKEIEKQLEDLFEMKLKQCREAEEAAEEIAKEREEVARFMEGEWQKVVQYEMKLADIELHRRKIIAQAESERARQEELHSLEMETDLKGLEEKHIELLELQEKLETDKAQVEDQLNRDKLTLDSTLTENLAELDELEQKIQLIAEKHDQYLTYPSSVGDSARSEENFDERTVTKVDYRDKTRSISDTGLTSKTVALDLRQRRRASWNFRSSKLSVSEGANDDAETQQLQKLFELKNEKEEIIEKTRGELTREITKVELYGRQILENEAKITELEDVYKISRQQHAEKIRMCLENLKVKEERDIALVDQDRERYVELLWKEYGEIESLITETFESLNSSDAPRGGTTSDARANDEKKLEVLNLVKGRLRQIGSDEDDLFLEYVAKRAHFEKDEDRVHEQQKRISEQVMDGIKEKEVALLKLSGQKERFHVERARERRLITSRIGRLSRVKSSGDLHNEEALEFFKEEARKLRETFEKVEESEMRLQNERREREIIHLQLEEARAKLRSSEEDREECEERLRDLKEQKHQKEKEISDLKRQMEEEKQSYLDNLKTEDYEVIEKPLVNRLHVKFRVIGNQAAAEVLKEALLASGIPEMLRTAPSSFRSPQRPTADSSHGGWTFYSTQKDVTIVRKREEYSGGLLHCFMGRGVISAPPQTVWEAVKNPLSRYIYDNMLKKINIVEHVEEGLKIVYMLHETSQCFMTHSRDFCYLSKERVEGDKYVLASQSIEHPKCPLSPSIIRGQIMSSGWIVEPLGAEGQEISLVWYITKVHLGSSTLPWRLIDLLSKRQPLSIAFLRSYLTPP